MLAQQHAETKLNWEKVLQKNGLYVLVWDVMYKPLDNVKVKLWIVQIDYIFQFESIRVESLNAISKTLGNLQVIHVKAHRFL